MIGSKKSGLVCERELLSSELVQADEVFVTNALLGVMPVVQVDERRYDLTVNPVTRGLMVSLEDQSRAV